MAHEIKIPELGENIKEGDVVRLLVKTGDPVVKDQPVVEIETGKASVEVPSTAAGTVAQINIKAGDKVKVGQTIIVLDGEGSAPAPEPKAEKAAEKPAPVPAAKPEAATPEAKPPPAPAAAPAAPEPRAAAPGKDRIPVAAAPSVRLFAREIGIDIDQTPGSGPQGRISIDDVKAFAKQLNTRRAAGVGPELSAGIPLPDFAKWGETQREAMSTIRRKTAEHMALCWTTIPHVTQHDSANITELEALRKRFAPRAEAAGGKLTLTAILLKILAAALKVFPKFNASIDLANNEVVYKKYFNIGVAVDTPRGLLVPVLRDADRKNIIQLAGELNQLAGLARDGKITMDQITGGSFTLTNLGGIGGSFFTPIINGPEVAILGVGRGKLEPTCGGKDGLCQPRLMLPLSLSYDHRLIDGADGARFLKWVVEAIEEPLMISLEG
ncbi:MAG TPA: branched-chain alpha-keto acid dehydrogenase subunit E2 [Verrucomicrobia bacterium]|nr:MAG: branched-chain alpha-keto acid dehydrogenase subunit E2 [Lentisphaerae bacterium GWF2_57_35]HBA82971.1 branched-chain alpha-keto acid dehydrogenase subunit E2 [Verrucomicrobiota bacterium]